MKAARVTISDRASSGVYADLSGPAVQSEMERLYGAPIQWQVSLIPDDLEQIECALRRLVDLEDCWLVITTGGTGPGLRDVTPEATRRVLEKELPGFGEAMRLTTFPQVPTAILSRAVAGIRGRSLIVNLPGNPQAIRECLPVLGPAIKDAIRHLRLEVA